MAAGEDLPQNAKIMIALSLSFLAAVMMKGQVKSAPKKVPTKKAPSKRVEGQPRLIQVGRQFVDEQTAILMIEKRQQEAHDLEDSLSQAISYLHASQQTLEKGKHPQVTLVVTQGRNAFMKHLLNTLNDSSTAPFLSGRGLGDFKVRHYHQSLRLEISRDDFWDDTFIGMPDPTTLDGVAYYLIHFSWTTARPVEGKRTRIELSLDNRCFNKWIAATPDQRKDVIRRYKECGIQVGLAVSTLDDSKHNNTTPKEHRFVRITNKYDFAGVDIDNANTYAEDVRSELNILFDALSARSDS